MSTNTSKEKREKLISEIKAIRDYIATSPQDENTGNLLTYLSEIEKDIKGKKYGLVFEEHREGIDEVLATHTPVLSEDAVLFINNGGQMNFLIEGDNLASLQLLEKTHKGKIDLIYIDPPYNTGNQDFVYDDSFVDSNDTFRHSKWLSFMQKRLGIAHNLLSNKGAIFISIDANEFAQLKILCDSIFGEGNFIGNMIWRKKTGGGQTDEFFVTEHEYIICYRKSSDFRWIDFKLEAKIEDFKYEDSKGKYSIVKLEKWGSSAHKEDRPTMYFPITAPDGTDFYPIAPDGKAGRWRVGNEKLSSLLLEDKVFWSKDVKKGRWVPYEKVYFDEAKGKLLKSRSILYDIAETGDATKQLTDIFGEKDVFQNPKPIELIEFIIKHCFAYTILDFFAGSGSTGHAVMKLNAEDDGSRKFILCTNNENNICRDITYERIKRVIDNENYSASLKYYKVDYVPISDKLYYEYADELLNHIKELVELENGVNFTGNNEITILLTEDEVIDFISNEAKLKACKKVYLGHDVLLDGNQEYIFDQNKIELNIIPEYYYKELEA